MASATEGTGRREDARRFIEAKRLELFAAVAVDFAEGAADATAFVAAQSKQADCSAAEFFGDAGADRHAERSVAPSTTKKAATAVKMVAAIQSQTRRFGATVLGSEEEGRGNFWKTVVGRVDVAVGSG